MTKKIVLFGSLVALVLGYVIGNPLKFGFCSNTYTFGENLRCSDTFFPAIGDFITLFSITIIVLLAVLYFSQESLFEVWIRFVYWWIPLTLFIVLLTPTTSRDWMFPIDKERVSLFMSGLLFLISLIIIIRKTIKLRGGMK